MPPTASPTLRQLRALVAVAATGSVGGAAADMGLSQPAVTQAIAKLESIIGVDLLRRSRTGSFLSPAGEQFLPRVQKCFRKLELALAEPCEGYTFATAAQAPTLIGKLTDTHLRSLIAIADAASFQLAARHLDISEPSLLRSARDLEHVLGIEIFQRSQHGVTTTLIGTELARRIHIALREVDYGLEDVASFNTSAETRLAIGIIPLFTGTVVSAAVEEFIQHYPNARIEVRDGTYDSLLSDLRSGSVDILIGNMRCPEWVTDVVEHTFFTDPFRVVARADHPLAELRRPLTIEDFASYPWVLPPLGAPRRESFLQLFADLEHPPRIAVETNAPALHRTILFASDCLAILTQREVAIEMRTGRNRLTVLSAPRLTGMDQKGYATRSDWQATPLQLFFLEALKRHAETADPNRHLEHRARASGWS